MKILISGGSKNGKTAFAEDVAVKISSGGARYYVATMIPYDNEDRARIDRHIAERAGKGFKTLECGTEIDKCVDRHSGTFLVDSVTALLVNEMFSGEHGGAADINAVDRCEKSLHKLAERAENTVFVTDYIFSDAMRYDDFTENYRKALATLDRSLAEVCDVVIELCAGNVIYHKGGLDF
ncbi:MAG: bifunctional adenosylcobinamide kinase/adenosylcobinamide-phosphate guanylyltransferase [Clostridia bacterium]|nr:bifunctional adenosylcobinamide kinase/adenosylcobinamide-phosphate guanylyltransferase [Clostridia bacterium]